MTSHAYSNFSLWIIIKIYIFHLLLQILIKLTDYLSFILSVLYQLQKMDSLDLTLRLGMSSNEDEQPQLPPTFNANGAFNMTQVLN